MARRRKRGFLMSLLLGDPVGPSAMGRGVHARSRAARRRKSTFEVDKHIAREIWAVAYLAIAIIFLMSVYGGFGVIGEYLNAGLEPVFGFGIHVIPALFLIVSATLFFSKNVTFGLSKATGLGVMMLSLLSIFHLSVPLNDLLGAAQAGTYGGYVGFVVNFLFREVLRVGHLGSAVIMTAGLIIGFLLTFEISIIELLKKAIPTFRVKPARKAARAGDDDDEEEEHEENEKDDDEDDEYEYEDDEENEDEDEDDDDEEKEVQIIKPDTIRMQEAEAAKSGKEIEITEEPFAKKKIKEHIEWEFPSLDLLSDIASTSEADDEILKANAETIRQKLEQFGIDVSMHDVHVGPTVVQYTLKPHEGIKLSKITSLKNDLALALAAEAIRIEAPIPGKSLVGIEVPNDHRSTVRLREILESKEFKKENSKLRLPLGRDVSGRARVGCLDEMPHILIAGATGAGKSVGINSFLISLLYQNSPEDLKMILIDPKRVELNSYNAIPHLLTPVITDVEKAAVSLRWAVAEMSRRYQLLASVRHRNIVEYNGDKKIEDKMPRIIILIDELADLMMAAGKEVEAAICRIAQMARAVGMHLIIATQRPSVDVITGLIKANIPCRIAFATTSGVDSRTILDGIGAEDLLGKGDMLYLPGGMSKPVRIQGTFISSEEIEKVTDRIKLTMEPDYNDEIISPEVRRAQQNGLPPSTVASDDTLYQEALKVIMESRKASASLLQRRLQVGYARAARLLDEMEDQGFIGPVQGAKPRDIYIERISAAVGGGNATAGAGAVAVDGIGGTAISEE